MNSLMGKASVVNCTKGVNLVRDSDDWYYQDRRFKEPEASSRKFQASKRSCLKFAYVILIWSGTSMCALFRALPWPFSLSLLQTPSPRPPPQHACLSASFFCINGTTLLLSSYTAIHLYLSFLLKSKLGYSIIPLCSKISKSPMDVRNEV